jgi:O-antigen/teichoic acid export membrane protein
VAARHDTDVDAAMSDLESVDIERLSSEPPPKPAPRVAASRRLRWELLLNFTGTGWSALVQLACIPIYLARLGAAQYGLIAFAATLALALKALDLGASQLINREFAGRVASGRTSGMRELLRTAEAVYVSIGVMFGGCIVIAAPVIGTRWLGATTLASERVVDAVRLIGLLMAVQWPLTFYQGALLGLRRFGTMNSTAIVASTASGGGSVVLLLWTEHRSLASILAWQCFVAALHTLAVATLAHRALPHDARPAQVLPEVLMELRRTITGVGALTLSQLVLLQGDKLLASRWLPLEGYGYYMLGATLANGLGVLAAPVVNTLLPRFSEHAARGNTALLAAEFRHGTRLLGVVVFPAMIALGMLAADALTLWTRSAATAHASAAPAALLLVGMGAASLMQLTMALQMATGRTRVGVYINAVLVVALVPLVGVGARQGAAGVARVWMALVAIGAIVGGVAVYRRQLGSGSVRWLLRDIGAQLAAMLGVALLASPLLSIAVPSALAAARLILFGIALTAASGLVYWMGRSASLPRSEPVPVQP